MTERPTQCRLCNTPHESFAIAADTVYGGVPGQQFYTCPSCSVAFLFPPLTLEEERYFYSKEFEKFMEKRAGEDFDWSAPEAHIRSNEKQFTRRWPFFSDLIKPGKHVLEIGCSSGFMLLPLVKMGVNVTGVEPSGGFTSFLKSQNLPVFDSLAALGGSSVNKQSFDLVMHFFVLEHVSDPFEFLREAFEFVAPGGSMVFEVPSKDDPLLTIYNIPAFQKFYWSVAHNYYFDRPSLEYLLKRITDVYEIIPEQRYDLSNHMTWALDGKPGGQGKYSSLFTEDLDKSYLQSMITTGKCDTLFCKITKPKEQ